MRYLSLSLAPHPLVSIIFVLAFAANFFVITPVFFNPDIPFHLKAGEWILEHGRIPVLDPWSYTASDTRWLNISWLWDICIYQIFSTMGAEGMYVVLALLGALTVAMSGYSVLKRGQADQTHILLTSGLLWLGLLPFLYMQPQMITFVLTPVFHFLCHNYRSGKVDKKRTAQMMCLMILWVNTHGGFFIGLCIPAAYALTAYMQRDMQQFRAFTITVALCALTCLVNPYHVFILEAVLRSLDSVITPYIREWHPPPLSNFAVSLPLFLFIVSSNVHNPRVPITDRIMVFTSLLFGLVVARNYPIFLLIAMPYLASNLQEFARATQGKKFTSEVWISGSTYHRMRISIFTAVTVFLLANPFTLSSLVDPEKFDSDPFRLREAVTYLKTRYPGTRFINGYNLGGGLIFHGDGNWPVFVDGRAGTAYPETVLEDAIQFNYAAGGERTAEASAILEKYNIGGILVFRMHRFAENPPSPEWKEVFRSDTIIAYVRE